MAIFVEVPHSRHAWLRALAAALPEHGITEAPDAARYALVWRQRAGLFAEMPALEAVFALGAGVERVLADPSLAPEVPVYRLRDAGMARQMVEYVSYAALHFQRDFDHYRRDQRASRWHARAPRAPMRVGVLGLGELGLPVTEALVALGFELRAWTRRPRAHDMLEVLSGDEGLASLLGSSELLVCLLPETPATRGLLDRPRLAALPQGAALINIGRGSLIDEHALVELLDAGHLRGAFLDVCATEPLPAEHRLWQHPRVWLTPHIAAATAVEPAVAQVAATIRAREGAGALPPSVDRDSGY